MNYIFLSSIAELFNAACDILELICEMETDLKKDPKIAEFEKKTLDLISHAIRLYEMTHSDSRSKEHESKRRDQNDRDIP